MNYYKINFLFKNKDADTEEINDTLYWYLGCLYKNGNALRDYRLVKKEEGYEAYIAIYEHYPPLKDESNKYIEQYEVELCEIFDITWEFLGELDGYNEVCTCEQPGSYLMYTTQYDEEYLILCGDCGGGCHPVQRAVPGEAHRGAGQYDDPRAGHRPPVGPQNRPEFPDH